MTAMTFFSQLVLSPIVAKVFYFYDDFMSPESLSTNHKGVEDYDGIHLTLIIINVIICKG